MRATTEISQASSSCHDARDQLEHVARRDHHGVILRSQASAIGMTRSQIDRRVRRGQWVSGPARGGLILAEYATSPASILLATVTVLNGVAWGRSALALWKLTDHPAKPSVAISKRAQGSNIDIVSLRELGDLHRTSRQGIATVSLDVAIAATASSRTQQCLDHLIDEALRQSLTSWPRIEAAFLAFSRQGRAGSGLLRNVLAERSELSAVPLSAWSRNFANKLASSGLTHLEMEHRVLATDGSLIAQVDLAFPEHHYAIELDSVQYHLNRSAFETDRRRDADLARVGWRVSRFTWSQFRDDWDWVISTITSQLHPARDSSATEKHVEFATR